MADILNLIMFKIFRVHPPLKSHIVFYINGLAILSGFHDIPKNLLIGTPVYLCYKLANVLGQHQG